jgi:hypothetical protein
MIDARMIWFVFPMAKGKDLVDIMAVVIAARVRLFGFCVAVRLFGLAIVAE